MNDKVKGIIEFLSSKCNSVEDWQHELSEIQSLEGLQGQVKKEIEKKIKDLNKSQPKFYINKVYKRIGNDNLYSFVIKGNQIFFHNITYNTFWKTSLHVNQIANRHSDIVRIKYLPYYQFQKMCKPGNVNPLDIKPIANKDIIMQTQIEVAIEDLFKDCEKQYGSEYWPMVRLRTFKETLVKNIQKLFNND